MLSSPPGHAVPRYWSLDMLRGLCALAVFLNHALLWSNFPPGGSLESAVHQVGHWLYGAFTFLTWPTGGQHPAVVCFFVLSGFCLHGPFARQLRDGRTGVQWSQYFGRRFRRIMPVYWMAALLGMLAMAAHQWRPTTDPLLGLHTSGTTAQIAARVGGWTGVWPEEVFAGNYTLGTVGTEIVIYVAYPLFFWTAARNYWVLTGGLMVAWQLLAIALRHVVDPFVLFSGILVMALFWYLGALAAHLHQRGGRTTGWWPVACWFLFIGLQVTPHFFGLNMIKQFVWGLVCTFGILWLVDRERRNEAWRTRAAGRLLHWAGDISYPLYAVHTPLILLANWLLLTFFTAHSFGWQLAINLSLSLVAAVAVHHLIERRFYRPRSAS